MEFQPKGWTLFLDRDGVINERIPGAYVEHPAQFVFTDKCLEAMAIFKKIFKRIVVVTNQQGIGKGGMSERQLQKVHNAMRSAVERAGGRIDGIYFCPDLEKFNP